MITDFKLYEFNKHDIYEIFKIDDYFTIALELEIKTNDPNIKNPSTTYEDEIIEKLKENTIKSFSKEYEINISDIGFIEDTLNSIDFENIDDFSIDPDYYKGRKNIIMGYISYFIDELDIDTDKLKELKTQDNNDIKKQLENNVKKYLPNFWNKYNNDLKYVLDMTIGKGIEIVPKTYLIGLNNIIKFVKTFYNDFDNQSYWYMNNLTGLHVNIGVNPKYNIKFNKVKGLILLKDYSDNSFVFKDNIERKNLKFTQSLINKLKNDISDLNFTNLKEVEKILNQKLLDIYIKYGFKTFGLNLSKIDKFNYVEFRYPGNKIKMNILIEKILYFSYIIYCMTNESYKKEKYLKELYKLLN